MWRESTQTPLQLALSRELMLVGKARTNQAQQSLTKGKVRLKSLRRMLTAESHQTIPEPRLSSGACYSQPSFSYRRMYAGHKVVDVIQRDSASRRPFQEARLSDTSLTIMQEQRLNIGSSPAYLAAA